MRNAFRTISITICILSLPQAAFAEKISNVTSRLVMANVSTENLRQPNVRLKLVEDAKTYCDEVDRVFPRNSPAEDL